MARRWNNVSDNRDCMNVGKTDRKVRSGKNGMTSKWHVFTSAYSWILVFVLTCTLIAPFSLTVHAATDEEYTYTVRLFAGAHGTVNGGEVMVFEDLKYGSPLPFTQRAVKLDDNSKYYIRGIRESGKDNSTTPTGDQLAKEYTVTGDQDYVVAYGVLGNAVAYTVEYVDADGNELAPTETYYGNVGDRPVVAFLYIEGYLPQAYNLTGTLQKNPADNVFRFTYEPLPTAGETPAPTPEPETPATTTPAAATPAAPAADVAAANAAAEAAGVTPPPLVQATDENVPLADGADGNEDGDGEGQEMMQVSDGQTPLGRGDFATLLLDLPAAAKAGILSILILLGAGGGYLYIRKKRMLNVSIGSAGNEGHDE